MNLSNPIGVSGFAWTAIFTERHLDHLAPLREYGISAYEVPMFDPRALPAAAIRRAMAANGLTCTVCAILPPGINPISPQAEVRRHSIAHLRGCLETAAEMGATLVGGPIYAPIGYLPAHRRTEEEWQWALEAFTALLPTLDATGMQLALEPVNRSETFFLTRAEDAARLANEIGHPRVGVTIDTFHANIEEKDLCAAIRAAGARLLHMHLSENDRGLLGSGHLDFAAILRTLAEIRYKGIFMIEGFGFSASEPQAPGALWADPAVSPEDLAREGARFLRSLTSR